MPRKKTNKSEKIREVIAANPTAGPNAIVELLAGQKIKVTPTLVSNVKSRMGAKPKKPGKRGRKPGRPSTNGNGQVNLIELVAAKKFAETVGGVEHATELLGALVKLQ